MDMKKILVKIIIVTLVISSAFLILSETIGEREEPDKGNPAVRLLERSIMELYMPGVQVRSGGQEEMINGDPWVEAVLFNFPVLLYRMQESDAELVQAAQSDYEELLLLEGSDEDRKNIEEGELEYGEDSLHLDKSIEDAVLAENGTYLESQQAQPSADADVDIEPVEEAVSGFVPAAERAYSYQWEELKEYNELIKAFYAVDSTTTADKDLIDLEKLLDRDMSLQGGSDNPQILIYHTHSQEAFADSVPGDESTSIVGMGEYLAEILREEYGYNVLHHTASYDKEARDYAYSNSLPEIERLLLENPSIEVVIDLHRDEMREGKKLVFDLQGRPTAQFMFFNGMSRTTKGEIEYLNNPYLEDNLAFSFQMQVASNEYYPGIARRIYLKAYRYNMHVCPKTLLIELGAQTNTVEEIKNACEPLAHVLHLVLSGEEPKR